MIKRSIILSSMALFACSSSSSSSGTTPTTDGGTGDGGGTSGNTAKFSGQIVGFASGTGEAGWNVEAGGVTAQTNAKGAYELALPKDTAFNLSVKDSAGGHLSLWDQETKISGDFDRGKLRFVEKATGDALISALKADATKGVVTIEMVAMDGSACASVADFPAGAKIKVDQASATLIYQSGNLPDGTKTEAQKAESPAATVINVTPDAALNVTVEYTKCKQKAFPVTDGAITYTGALKAKAPNTISVYRVFFE